MARLKALPDRVQPLPDRLGVPAGGAGESSRDRRRDPIHIPLRKLYKTNRWQRVRWSVLVRDGFTCQACGRVADSPQLVADHVVPARVCGAARFFDDGNLQTLCKPCHDVRKQAEEAGGGWSKL